MQILIRSCIVVAGSLFIGSSLYTMLVWVPYNLYNEAKCLAAGYPESKVSVGLEGYCMNLDGSVTVRVDRQ